MVFFKNKSDLDYYQDRGNVPCYCEELLYASDMAFQIQISTQSTTNLTAQFYVYSVDGNDNLENATAYFERYFFIVNGQKYMNARLMSFSPTMCSQACYILRVVITGNDVVIFDQFSQQYCQNQCCDVPRGIYISNDNEFQIPADTPTDEFDPPTGGTIYNPDAIPTANCGQPLIRLITYADCLDPFGVFYGIPTNTLIGNATWGFQKILNLSGRVAQRPRDIQRQTSYNDRLQRSESAKQFLLQGFEWFPAWKMSEIEDMLHAPTIIIDDFKQAYSYQWDGGTAFEKLGNDCTEVFKLNVTLRGSFKRAVFSCTPDCYVSPDGYIAIPAGYETNYFDETGRSIANDFESLLQWFNGQQGVTAVEQSTTGYACEDKIYKLIKLTGTSYVPTSIYAGQRNQDNRLFLQRLDDPESICALFPDTGCNAPEIGTITYADEGLLIPEIGTITYTDETPETLTLYAPADWTITTQDVGLVNGLTVVLEAELTTTLYSGADTQLANLIIAYMPVEGRPNAPQNITVGDVLVSILPNGEIRYTGQVTNGDGTSITITLSSITYNIQ